MTFEAQQKYVQDNGSYEGAKIYCLQKLEPEQWRFCDTNFYFSCDCTYVYFMRLCLFLCLFLFLFFWDRGATLRLRGTVKDSILGGGGGGGERVVQDAFSY